MGHVGDQLRGIGHGFDQRRAAASWLVSGSPRIPLKYSVVFFAVGAVSHIVRIAVVFGAERWVAIAPLWA